MDTEQCGEGLGGAGWRGGANGGKNIKTAFVIFSTIKIYFILLFKKYILI